MNNPDLVVQGPDGQMQSWAVVVTPQADPPTIENYIIYLGLKPRPTPHFENVV